MNPRKDEEKIKQRNQEIREILQKYRKEIEAGMLVVYAIDECHLMGGYLVGQAWGISEKRVEIPIDNYRDKTTYYGALNLFEPEFILSEYPRGNGEYTVDFLKHLQSINEGKKLLIFWDGASYHRGQIMKDFLGTQNDGLEPEEWMMICQLFAPYAPEENPVEAIWFQLKSLLRRFYCFGKNFKIVNYLFQLFAKYELFKFPDLDKFDAFSQLN